MIKQLANDFLPKDLPRNHKVGIEGEKVWVRYLQRNGFKAYRKTAVSAVGPDVYAVGRKANKKGILFIGEVKASRSRLPGVAKLKWNIMSGFRQMSWGWIDKYGSDVVNGFIKLGVKKMNIPLFEKMLDRGEIELYLLGALQQKGGKKWLIRGFRLLHVSTDEIESASHGLPEIVEERTVNRAGKQIKD